MNSVWAWFVDRRSLAAEIAGLRQRLEEAEAESDDLVEGLHNQRTRAIRAENQVTAMARVLHEPGFDMFAHEVAREVERLMWQPWGGFEHRLASIKAVVAKRLRQALTGTMPDA